MNGIFRLSLAMFVGWLAACTDLTDSVLFVTDTKIAIDADSKPPNINIGYSRDETFIGPNFEGNTGAIPPVVGQLKTNLAILSPEVEQIYATGHAASLATKAAEELSTPRVLAPGENKKLVYFRTGANLGLKVVFANNVPESIDLGYKRKELSFIPLVKTVGESESTVKDVYGSALAFIGVNTKISTPTETSLGISQFFATGIAAESLAKTDTIRGAFQTIAKESAGRATFDTTDPTVACIETWLNSDDSHPGQLQSWWEGKGLQGLAVLLIDGKEYKKQRLDFMAEKQIACNP
jgi:hypothetical protein